MLDQELNFRSFEMLFTLFLRPNYGKASKKGEATSHRYVIVEERSTFFA